MKLVRETFCYRCGWDRARFHSMGCAFPEQPLTLDAFIARSAAVVAVEVLGLRSYAGPWDHDEIVLVRALTELLNQSADLDEKLADQELPH